MFICLFVCFSSFIFSSKSRTRKALSLKEYEQFLEEISKNKKVPLEDIKQKLCACGPPATRIQVCGPLNVSFIDSILLLTRSSYVTLASHSSDVCPCREEYPT